MLQQYVAQILNNLAGRGRIRRPLVWLTQAGIFVFSGLLAFALRFDYTLPPRETAHLAMALAVWIVVKTAIFRREKLDSGWWSLVSIFEVMHLGLVNVAASVVSAGPIFLIAGASFPRSIYVLDLLICFLATAGIRITFRLLFESVGSGSRDASAKRVIIYGAGSAGVMLAREARVGAKNLYRVCGFVDDDPNKRHSSIQGLTVLGPGAQLPALVRKHNIEEVLIAMPSATGAAMTSVLSHCSDARVPYKTVPTLTEVLQGQSIAKNVRKVSVEDLLGRSPVHLDERQISESLRGRVVLVTGAGGSIGSELCRQLARFSPQAIVGYDNAENTLFHLDLEMRERFPDVPFYPQIGSIQNARRFSEVLTRHGVAIVYHAAAYKHVPLLEAHAVEAVENNVLGTATVARISAVHNLEAFVMISTDKAVKPTSMLGATKRLAELAVNSFAGQSTKFVSVRFGNVLGSNGSVIPLFQKQIAAGGPVTVTHPDMHRYFMTIPEAAQLVLQAAAMGSGGEIFVLDMGEPMKILDLARNLIILSGLRPDEDIQIAFSGLRPGEKLFEELSSSDEAMAPTAHEKIQIFRGLQVPREQIQRALRQFEELCARRDIGQIILALKGAIPDYNPSAQLLEQALEARAEGSSLAALATAVESFADRPLLDREAPALVLAPGWRPAAPVASR